MTLKALDEKHFYINDKLVDLVWIGYHTHRRSSGANHHDVKRNLNWLSDLAERLLTGHVAQRDERLAKRRLSALGYDWSLQKLSHD